MVLGLLSVVGLLITVREELLLSLTGLPTPGAEYEADSGVTTIELILIVLMAAMLGRFWKDKDD